MEGVKIEPLRTLDDFLLQSARFQTPDFGNLDRWNNRVKENLIYFQTNYFLSAIIIFLVVGVMNPADMILGMCSLAFCVLGYNQLAKNQAVVENLKKKHPFICFILLFIPGYFVVSRLGSVLVFLFGILLPFVATFIHASLRLRSNKNKLSNLKEKLQLKKTPMGLILEELGMAFEGFSD